MNKLQYWILAAVIASPTFLMAQTPAEELSPTAPEFNIEVMDAPVAVEPQAAAPAEAPATPTVAPTLQTIAPTIAPMQMPVAEAKPAEAPKVEEDNSVKGITLSPAVTLKPIGYNGERHQWFVEVKPSVGLGSVFKTEQGRKVALNAGYEFTWDEFLTRRQESGIRYFEHDLTGDATIAWNSIFSTKFTGEFDYSLWASENREFGIASEETAQGIFKINDQFTLNTGYRLFYFNDLDTQFHLSDGSLPGDLDDIRQSNAGTGGANSYDPLPGYDPTTGNLWFANNGLVINPVYKVTKDTTVGLNYEYVFLTMTNTDSAAWKGHWITAKITQKMPWKGGKITLKDQLRLRNYDSKSNDDGSLVSNLRNRLTLTIGQSITDSISAEFYYRWAFTGSNKDNYGTLENEHQVNLGFTFSF